MKIDKPKTSTVKVFKRNFSSRNIEQLKYFLEKELWQNIYTSNDANTSYNSFLNKLLCYFKGAFPIKKWNAKKVNTNKWITQG
jgi:hypothetical protein